MPKAIEAILIKLPRINDEWIETVEGNFYAAGWEEFQKSYPEIYEVFDETPRPDWHIALEFEIRSYIPGYIKEIFEETHPRMWGVQLTSIEDIETYNKLVQCVCSSVVRLIHLIVSEALEDGGKRLKAEWPNNLPDNYSEIADSPNIYEEEEE